MANDRCVSIRVTEEQYEILRKEAKVRKVTVSMLVRELLFPSVSADDFHKFKSEIFSANKEMMALLLELTKHVRFSSSVSANLFTCQRPEAVDKLRTIHDGIFNEAVTEHE